MTPHSPARPRPPRPVLRHRLVLLGAVIAVTLADAALVVPHGDSLRRAGGAPIRTRTGARASISWPAQGQAALALTGGWMASTPDERPAPIASLAKVMTAYLTLRRYPLDRRGDGFTLTVTPADAEAEATDAAQGQSVVAVRAGERLTERQLLEALLIPSGNNVARMLAAFLGGRETGFVAQMNAEARALGMDDTSYTDPSGFDPRTVSTAADQLRIFDRAIRLPAFRQIVSMPSVTLPVAGTVTNFDPILAAGFPGKTGSDSAAGGCLAFSTHVVIAGHRRVATGVVLGQGEGDDTADILGAAGNAARRMIASL
jgi:serine-type D-Ala-D-Ala carboxypeptidase (penicillin-binding protein 5/6)